MTPWQQVSIEYECSKLVISTAQYILCLEIYLYDL